jgi:hypothetical protein
MSRLEDGVVPPRVKAAFEFLHHTWLVTEQINPAIPVRSLTPLERSVESAALRAVQQYLLGEMDFVEESPKAEEPRRDDDDTPASPAKSAN